MNTIPPGLCLRPATRSDQAAVQHLIFSVLREYGLQPDPTGTDRDLSAIEESYFHRGGYFGVVEGDRGIVATVGLLALAPETCELRKMYALPLARGLGLGHYLLDFATDMARRWQCRRIVLETAAVLKEAIGLYRRHGFQPYQPPTMVNRCDMAMELILENNKSTSESL